MLGKQRMFERITTADVNKAVVHPAPCALKMVYCGNLSTTAMRFVKVFDLDHEPVLGYDTPVITFVGHKYGSGSQPDWIEIPLDGLAMQNGLAIAVTSGIADGDATVAELNGAVVQLLYEVP